MSLLHSTAKDMFEYCHCHCSHNLRYLPQSAIGLHFEETVTPLTGRRNGWPHPGMLLSSFHFRLTTICNSILLLTVRPQTGCENDGEDVALNENKATRCNSLCQISISSWDTRWSHGLSAKLWSWIEVFRSYYSISANQCADCEASYYFGLIVWLDTHLSFHYMFEYMCRRQIFGKRKSSVHKIRAWLH